MNEAYFCVRRRNRDCTSDEDFDTCAWSWPEVWAELLIVRVLPLEILGLGVFSEIDECWEDFVSFDYLRTRAANDLLDVDGCGVYTVEVIVLDCVRDKEGLLDVLQGRDVLGSWFCGEGVERIANTLNGELLEVILDLRPSLWLSVVYLVLLKVRQIDR